MIFLCQNVCTHPFSKTQISYNKGIFYEKTPK